MAGGTSDGRGMRRGVAAGIGRLTLLGAPAGGAGPERVLACGLWVLVESVDGRRRRI